MVYDACRRAEISKDHSAGDSGISDPFRIYCIGTVFRKLVGRGPADCSDIVFGVQYFLHIGMVSFIIQFSHSAAAQFLSWENAFFMAVEFGVIPFYHRLDHRQNPPVHYIQYVMFISLLIYACRMFFIASVPTFEQTAEIPSWKFSFKEGLQKALDDANAAGGGIVYLPAGIYRLAKPVTVGEKTVIMGAHQNPQNGSDAFQASASLN